MLSILARRTRSPALRLALLIAALGVAVAVHSSFDTACPAETRSSDESRYQQVIDRLSSFIERERVEKGLPAVSIALVDGCGIVWAQGFGWASPEERIPASAGTVYRVGSVSKLLTALATMRLVEQGVLELDVPVTRYLPDFEPENPWGRPVTLRHLLGHRAGIVREPVVGGYFDSSQPTLAAAVASLNQTSLVFPPGQRWKYSNAGVAVVGRVIERVTGDSFSEHVKRQILVPAGMYSSAFERHPELRRRLATGYLWTYDGTAIRAPIFDLGVAPAGGLYATVEDLGRLLVHLFAENCQASSCLIQKATLREMMRPQYGPPRARHAVGLGLFLGELEGRQLIHHGGAIYGYATEVAALPVEQLGVVVVSSLDSTNPVVQRIAREALRLMLAADGQAPLAVPPATAPVPRALGERLAGHYHNGTKGFTLELTGDNLFLESTEGGVRREVRIVDGALVTDGRLGFGQRITPVENGINLDGWLFPRTQPRHTAPPVPAGWRGLLGSYGWDHNPVQVAVANGRLEIQTEWLYRYPLLHLDDDVFAFLDPSIYAGETVVFSRDSTGRGVSVRIGSVFFPRRRER